MIFWGFAWNFYVKFFLLIAFFLFLLLIIFNICNFVILSQDFEADFTKLSDLNQNPIFSIDKILLFSSASADNNEQTKALWDLNIHQYTDIAIYINNVNMRKLVYI